MLPIGANRGGSPASYRTRKADGITQITCASVLRFPGKLWRHSRLLSVGRRGFKQTKAANRREARQQQGRTARKDRLAAREEARSKGRKPFNGMGQSPD